MNHLLYKVVVSRFYQINTGFFLLLFVLFFGILNGQATIELHLAIMDGINHSYAFFAAACLVCALYAAKCTAYALQECNNPANGFLYELQSLTNKRQALLLAGGHAAMYLPVLVYAALTAAVGLASGQVALPIGFLLWQAAMLALGTGLLFHKINTTWQEPAIQLPRLDFAGKKKPFSYLLHYSLHQRKGTFIAVKLTSLLLLKAMVAANSHKVSKEAVSVLILFLISVHSLLPLYDVRFVEGEMGFLRNLPWPKWKRIGLYTCTYAVVFLPELAYLLLNSQHNLPPAIAVTLYLLAVVQLSLYTSILYLPRVSTNQYTTYVFLLFFVNLLLLASFYLWFLLAAETIAAIAIFMWRYERYEA